MYIYIYMYRGIKGLGLGFSVVTLLLYIGGFKLTCGDNHKGTREEAEQMISTFHGQWVDELLVLKP